MSKLTKNEGTSHKGKFLKVKNKITPYGFLSPALLILGGILLFPLVYSLFIAFHEWNMASGEAAKFVFLNNFIDLFQSKDFWNSVRLQVLFVIISVSIELVIGIAVAIFLNRKFAGDDVVRALLLLPTFILPVVSGLAFRFMYNPQYGAINWFIQLLGFEAIPFLSKGSSAFMAIIIQDVWRMWPFMFMIIYASISTLPKAPYEAAVIAGANKWELLRHITLPLLKPSIIVAVILRVLNALKAFSEIYVMTNGGPGNSTSILSVFIYKNAFKYYEIGYSAAASYILVAIALIFSIILVKKQFDF
ncbi:MAG: carbohydrate ABC transporter permease [Bacillota bacterium]